MRTRSLTDLILDVRQRTDLENSTFVTDAEIQEFLNQELAELWGHLTQGSGAPPYRSLFAIAVTSAQPLYPLPVDFWQVQNVEATIDSVNLTLRSFGPFERSRLLNSPTTRYPWCTTVRYRIQAGNIEFEPATRSFPATLFYTPSCPRLVSGTDTFDGFNGFEVAAIYGACATVQTKEETDPSFYEGRKAAIYRQIDSLAGQRDAAEPERVQDVSGADHMGAYGWTR